MLILVLFLLSIICLVLLFWEVVKFFAVPLLILVGIGIIKGLYEAFKK